MKKFKILDLVQGSEKWIKARLDFLCASEAPAVMDESKFMSRNQLLDLKKGWLSNPNSSFLEMLFEKGHLHEEMARPIFELDEFEDFPPMVASFEVAIDCEHLTFLASFDGLGEDSGRVWEHKDWNITLSENIRNGVLEPLYYWQLEHQMIVAGVKEATITCSDGTINNKVSMTYKSVPKRRKDLIKASNQFMIDLENHELNAKIETFHVEKNISLPAITYEVSGTEIISNIASCIPLFKDQATFEISRTLESDQDFADKDKMNKAVIKARAELKEQVKAARSKFFSFSKFEDAAGEIDKILLKMQSHGVKQVLQAKSAKKELIKTLAEKEISDYSLEVDKLISPIRINSIYSKGMPDFDLAMKNKRTIESLQNAVDSVIAEVKIEVNELKDKVIVNLNTLRESAGEYEFLFMDTQQLILKDNESLIAIIKTRISEHKQAEQKKLDDHRKKIQLEEEEKARIKIADEVAEKAKKQAKLEADEAEEKERKNKQIAQLKADMLKAEEEGRQQLQSQQQAQPTNDHELCCSSEFPSKEPLGALPLPSKSTVSERLAETFKDVPSEEAEQKTKKFRVQVEWSGYSRGYSIYEVEASSEDEAKENWYEGEKIEHEVVRDDTEKQEVTII